MNNIEEKLWNYIDGNCTPAEQKTIIELLESDENYRLKYQELLKLNDEFAHIELDEPPMAFTYHVMEAVRAEHASQPLKSTVNKRIINAIAIFFIASITLMLVFTFSNINLSEVSKPVTVPADFKMPALSNYLTRPIIQGFVFFDVVLALFLFDAYLRRKKQSSELNDVQQNVH